MKIDGFSGTVSLIILVILLLVAYNMGKRGTFG